MKTDPSTTVLFALKRSGEKTEPTFLSSAVGFACLFVCWLVGWLLNVPGTCECISGTDLHRQFYVLPQ